MRRELLPLSTHQRMADILNYEKKGVDINLLSNV